MGAFLDVFSSANSRFKGTESRSEPRITFRLATGEFGNYWCMFVKYRQSGIISNQERAK